MEYNMENLIREYFKSHFQVHEDWTGEWVEYAQHCGSVEAVAEELIKYIKNDGIL